MRALIRLARQNDLHALFVNVSFVGSESLVAALGRDGDGVIISQVVPHFDANLPIVRDYRAALAASSPPAAPTFGLVGRLHQHPDSPALSTAFRKNPAASRLSMHLRRKADST